MSFGGLNVFFEEAGGKVTIIPATKVICRVANLSECLTLVPQILSLLGKEKPRKRLNLRGLGRTGRDSNPRYAFDVHTISNRLCAVCKYLTL